MDLYVNVINTQLKFNSPKEKVQVKGLVWHEIGSMRRASLDCAISLDIWIFFGEII